MTASQVFTPIQYIDVTMTTPTDAQDAGDVVADTQVVTGACRQVNAPAILDSVALIDVDDQKALLNLVFLSSNVSLGTEDAAPSITDPNSLNFLGLVSIVAADYVDLGGVSVVSMKNIGLVVKPASGTADIYMAIYTPATSTPTYAGGSLTVRLGFRTG